LGVSELIPDIAAVAEAAGSGLARTAAAYFQITEQFRLGWLADAARAVAAQDFYDGLALSRANDLIAAARRRIAVSALRSHPRSTDPVSEWLKAGGAGAQRLEARMREIID